MHDEVEKLKRFALILIIAWTAAGCASLWWNFERIRRTVMDEVAIRARATYKTDLMYRKWNATHGGVYVPITESTQPNPYLDNILPEDRDVTTTTGKKLTLINPAYMTRQVFESNKDIIDGVQRHLTSLKPIRPENAPDEWEAEALHRFEEGEKEVVSVSYINGRKYLRFMSPFITEEPCLKCHVKQGYEVGDVRGGVSVSVPMDWYDGVMRRARLSMLIGHLILWIVGVVAVIYGKNRIIDAISQLEKAEKSAKFTQFAVDNSTDAVFWLRPNGSFYYANNEACARLGFTRREFENMKVFEISATASEENWPRIVKRLRDNKSDVNITEHKTKSGERIPTEVTSNLITYEGEEFICSFAKDISERTRAEKEKELLQEQLLQSQKMEAVGMLASGIAHDFNNMLGIIMGAAQLIDEDEGAECEYKEDLEIIMGTVNRAKALTTKLLVFGRDEKLKIKPSDMERLVNEVVALVKRGVSKRIEISVDCEQNLPAVLMDERQIEQAMINICNNAVDAMGEGGTLEITVKAASETPLKEAAAEAKRCYVTFTDTGHGVNPEHLDKIFNPFFTTKESGKGTGLGLSVTHGIINQHDGEIFIGNVPGKGACVTIVLPFADGEAVSGEPSGKKGHRAGAETVFIVDDEQLITDVTKKLLEKRGYNVIAHTSSAKAIEDYEKLHKEIDVVIADFNMPGIDGIQVLRKFKKISPDLKCVMISGFCENAIMDCAETEHGCRFLEKPFEIEKLCEIIRGLLDS